MYKKGGDKHLEDELSTQEINDLLSLHPWIPISAAAQIKNVSVSTIRNLCSQGVVNQLRLSNSCTLINLNDIPQGSGRVGRPKKDEKANVEYPLVKTNG